VGTKVFVIARKRDGMHALFVDFEGRKLTRFIDQKSETGIGSMQGKRFKRQKTTSWTSDKWKPTSHLN